MRGCLSVRDPADGAERGCLPYGSQRESGMPDLIWIIVIVLVVLFVLGYFGRGRFRR
jgi:cobalamin biosynthesis Mg chelatase CobN